jgi:uracil-DNA glycosylase
VIATVHPSSILRADDREREYRGLVEDLKTVAQALGSA